MKWRTVSNSPDLRQQGLLRTPRLAGMSAVTASPGSCGHWSESAAPRARVLEDHFFMMTHHCIPYAAWPTRPAPTAHNLAQRGDAFRYPRSSSFPSRRPAAPPPTPGSAPRDRAAQYPRLANAFSTGPTGRSSNTTDSWNAGPWNAARTPFKRVRLLTSSRVRACGQPRSAPDPAAPSTTCRSSQRSSTAPGSCR